MNDTTQVMAIGLFVLAAVVTALVVWRELHS